MFIEKSWSSLCAHEVDVRVARLILRRHISPILGVMIGIDDGEYCMMHMSVFCAAGHVEKVEFHCLAVWRQLACHPRPVPPDGASLHRRGSLRAARGPGVVLPGMEPS